tara:strand:+ start:13139 stop:13861 length:723 start_codon:yes stop_codon:yes gene_type:complete
MYNKISSNYSPNFTTSKRIKKNIKYLVFHYTGMRSETKAINRLIDENSKVSCHYLIKKNGEIILMVPETYTAWHAGISFWKNQKNLNKSSIGIEITNKGHHFGYENYSRQQILSLIKLSKYLIKKYNINKKNILGHSDIAFNRKKDPGEKFPWQYLASRGIGIWNNKKGNSKKYRKIKIEEKNKLKFIFFLKKIGYLTKFKSKIYKNNLIKAFQRRFRPELIDGKIDKECFLIAKILSKN